MAGVVGLEPTPAIMDIARRVLKTRVLPLHYTPKFFLIYIYII